MPAHCLIQGVARQALNDQPESSLIAMFTLLGAKAVSVARRLGLAAVVCAVANNMTLQNLKSRCKRLEIRWFVGRCGNWRSQCHRICHPVIGLPCALTYNGGRQGQHHGKWVMYPSSLS